jgi:6,7-dimethyl-8-ribityllumazine synthase
MSHKYLILTAKFNEMITKALLAGAHDAFAESGIDSSDVDSIWVPGAFELPVAAAKAARTDNYQAIICLGCVIQGETPHFDFVSGQAAAGIMQVSIDTEVPIIFGVLTTNTAEQALQRSGLKGGNKGADAVRAAITMTQVMNQLQGANNL